MSDEVEVADAVEDVVGLVAFFVELDAQAQVVGGVGLADGFVVVDGAGDIEVEEVLVEGLHAVALAARHEVFDAQQVAFEYQILHGGGVDHQIDDGGAAFAAFFDDETLADDADEVHGQVDQNLFVPLFGIQVHDTLDGLVGGGGVDGKDAEVAGLGELEGVFHAFHGAHLADADDVGGLAHRALHGDFPAFGVDADFALGDDGAAGDVQILDGVFDGNDVAGQVAVAVVEHGGHGGGFTGAGRARQDEQAAFLHDEFFEFEGQGEVFHGGDFGVDAAHDEAAAALFVVGVDAVAHVAFGLHGIVDFVGADVFFALGGVHGGGDNLLGFGGGEGGQGHGDEVAVDFHRGGKAGADENIGRAAFFGFFAHARQDGVQVPADGGGAFVGKMGVVVGRVVGHDFVQQAVEVLRD